MHRERKSFFCNIRELTPKSGKFPNHDSCKLFCNVRFNLYKVITWVVGTMRKKSKMFLWESVVGLGFLSGLWTAIGINPQSVIIGLIGQSASGIYPDPAIRALFLILPTIFLVISVISAYRRGKIPGLFSVIIAYTGGLLILVSPVLAMILLIAAVVIGILATR